MGGSGGHRRLPGGSDDFRDTQTHKQTLHHNIYIIKIIITIITIIITEELNWREVTARSGPPKVSSVSLSVFVSSTATQGLFSDELILGSPKPLIFFFCTMHCDSIDVRAVSRDWGQQE